jgi:Zn-finger protein
MIDTINKGCIYYPCHKKEELQSCVFCYCFRYPCNDASLGIVLKNGIWSCESCTWPHNGERVDNIFDFLNREFL